MLTILSKTSDKENTSVVRGLTGPMWLLAVASTLLYITYTLQVFKFTENVSHILHTIVSSKIRDVCIKGVAKVTDKRVGS